ncbi:hypothetical protein [Burkholderia oklahomensis]|uniref:Flagellar hook-length control protein FliK n=1 Tax=Burkholderia oklahomensis TaxID=342113 RepID=A0AAI8BDD0_9BURK|nr:hypothetical protein DM82_4224 [Burkholderia oklahomensis]
MTDSAAFPRTRSSRSSASKRRPRAAAAGGLVQSRVAARSGRDAAASEALRDEHTLDLFGGAAAREAKPTAKAENARSARATARGGERAGEQADLLSGFAEDSAAHAQREADERSAADAAGTRTRDAASAGESVSVPASSVESASADAGSGRRDTPAVQVFEPATAQSGADDAPAAGQTDSRRSSSRRANSKKQAAQRGAHRGSASQGDAKRDEAARGQTAQVQGEAAHDPTPEHPTRQSAADEARSTEAPAAPDTANIEPTDSTRADPNQANPEPPSPVATRAAAVPERRDAGSAADTPALAKTPKTPRASGNATPAAALSSAPSGTGGGDVAGVPTQSTPSAASPTSFPASASPARERQTAAPQTASAPSNAPAAPVELDAHLRPLADRIRALQSETVDLRRAADAEMRRVNRLLLALGVVALIAIVALVAQAVQLSRQRDESAALQQRIDRLAAAQATQEATIVTLSQRQDELGAQVDRLTNRLSGAATPVKRSRRGRGY